MSLFAKLGDEMKDREKVTRSFLNPDQPHIIRLDGKAFHTLTKGAQKPFDNDFAEAMKQTMRDLMEFSNAQMAYTQSDEISLVYFKMNPMQHLLFNGNVQKIASVLASKASIRFYHNMQDSGFDSDIDAVFDARVFNVDDLEMAAKNIMWRQMDCTKNAISMAAHAYFSNKELHGVGSESKIAKLKTLGIDFYQDYTPENRTGCFAVKQNYTVCDGEGGEAMRTEIVLKAIPDIILQYGKVPSIDDYLFKSVFKQYDDMMDYKKMKKVNS